MKGIGPEKKPVPSGACSQWPSFVLGDALAPIARAGPLVTSWTPPMIWITVGPIGLLWRSFCLLKILKGWCLLMPGAGTVRLLMGCVLDLLLLVDPHGLLDNTDQGQRREGRHPNVFPTQKPKQSGTLQFFMMCVLVNFSVGKDKGN